MKTTRQEEKPEVVMLDDTEENEDWIKVVTKLREAGQFSLEKPSATDCTK